MMLKQNIDWSQVRWEDIWPATKDTLTMIGASLLFTVILGLLIGIILFLTSRKQLLEQPVVYGLLSLVVNILRSVPFVILMILIMPFTKVLTGTTLGVQGTIPPLVVAAAPFFARLVETSLREVDKGVIEAAQAMGASRWDIVRRVLLLEARPGLLAGITITAVTLVSYTAMAGVIGGGGLGDLALRYGYQRFQLSVMIVTVLMLIILVQLLQMAGDHLVRRFSRK
ncbi:MULTISPECIES: methionine ABC transporter permease [unclassified Paenibacillus]|uniref:methionine ABC transporter permease n=1 Tax=unclassified Paenibacillus TaxID=185978 RepID=UPI001045AF46|nr:MULTISPECIES: methionine ABC transporter permease [unclassified Paenibacillus]NIK67661.1 D-methionine transport system permease protein [Paenibacillus sp. BK720]TCN01701.1 D-methionine transport system permease protein [Paenibacillus sp. BK033]